MLAGVSGTPELTRAYRGRDTANMNRRWEWQPVSGATRYLVTPDWSEACYVEGTSWEHREPYVRVRQRFSDALTPGQHTLMVQAEVGGALGPPATDTFVVRYSVDSSVTEFQRQDVGQYGIVSHTPGLVGRTDVVGLKYRFRVHENEGSAPGNKIIFGATQLEGPAGAPYRIVQQFNAFRTEYRGPLCDQQWPPPQNHPDESSVKIAMADYTGRDRIGMRTQSPGMLPLLFSYVDGDVRIANQTAECQRNLNGVDGQIIMERGAPIADREGWRCGSGRALGNEAYREWRVALVLGEQPFTASFAVPEECGAYISPTDAQSCRWEFALFPGRFTFYAWDLMYRPDGADWEPIRDWQVNESLGFDADFGAKLATYESRSVVAMSNDAPSDYLSIGTVFTV